MDGTVFFNGSSSSADGVTCTLIPSQLVQVCLLLLSRLLLSQVTPAVQGLGVALMAMKEGDRWEIVVPPQLGYQGSKHGKCLCAAAVSLIITTHHLH